MAKTSLKTSIRMVYRSKLCPGGLFMSIRMADKYLEVLKINNLFVISCVSGRFASYLMKNGSFSSSINSAKKFLSPKSLEKQVKIYDSLFNLNALN